MGDEKLDSVEVMDKALEEICRHQVALHDPALERYLHTECDVSAEIVDAFLALVRETLH